MAKKTTRKQTSDTSGHTCGGKIETVIIRSKKTFKPLRGVSVDIFLKI